ncbi:hypothetical protein [Aeromonas veronii]|uniref:hypothetical protein n=1 Tax=Aeromonas veronii TaxID=654 RepID=UPI001BCB4ADD|nr:hypothetical protein [Aeromonas veronii]MBS4705257.1 hypothetical protein [Aeromonas veronii]
MNALDKALASLELDDVVPATGVTSADADLDALEALLEPLKRPLTLLMLPL